MSENTFYQDGSVLITNTRAVLGAKTYAMANITSVSMKVIPADYTISIVVGLIGLFITACAGCVSLFGFAGLDLNSSSSAGPLVLGVVIGLFGVCGIGAGIALAFLAKPTYAVRIGSASGEGNVLASKDRDYIQKIITAMNEAIIKRG